MRVSDRILGIGLIVFAVILGTYSQTFPDVAGQQYGASVFPTMVAFGMAACGVTLVVQGWSSQTSAFHPDDWVRRPSALAGLAGAGLAMTIYILVVDRLGFLPTMFLLLASLLAIMRVRWWLSLVVAVVTTLAIYTVFVNFLLVPLPRGIVPRGIL